MTPRTQHTSPGRLRDWLGRTICYHGHLYTVEHVRTTWRRVMPPIDEVAIVPLQSPASPLLWVYVADICCEKGECEKGEDEKE